MADAAVTNTIFTGKRRQVIHMTSTSDATGESGAIKVDRSALPTHGGAAPTTIIIYSARWAIQGFTSVKLLWHHNAADVVAMLLTSNGYDNFESYGGLHDSDLTNADAADGDLQLTTTGAAANATYDITLEIGY